MYKNNTYGIYYGILNILIEIILVIAGHNSKLMVEI